MLEPVAWRWRWGKLGYTAWHLSEERPAFPEDGYECEPLYAALTTSAEHVRETPGSEHEALAVTKAHLREHWLASIVCDHEAKTDVAVCSCSQWKDEPHPSVGAAVDAWIDHVFDTLPATRTPQTPMVGANPTVTENVMVGAEPMEAEPVGWRHKDWWPKDEPFEKKRWIYGPDGPDEDSKDCLWEPLYASPLDRASVIEECAAQATAVRTRLEAGRKGRPLNQIDEHVASVADSLAERIRALKASP